MKNILIKRLKPLILISFTAIAVLIFLVIIFSGKDKLSENEILNLRDDYPICGVDAPIGLEMGELSMSQITDLSDTYIYGKVVGDISTYTVSSSTGSDKLDKKLDENNISTQFEFYEYTVSVIEDLDGIYKKGDLITIASSKELMSYNPELCDGMEIVFPIIQDDDKPSRCYSVVHGMYYVTEKGYAISAYDDSDSQVKLTGYKVDKVLDEIEKIS